MARVSLTIYCNSKYWQEIDREIVKLHREMKRAHPHREFDMELEWEEVAEETRCPRCGGGPGSPSCGKSIHEMMEKTNEG
jgi:rubredoxin